MSVDSRNGLVSSAPLADDLWRRYTMALDDLTLRLQRITSAFDAENIPYALVGGQAVALWVATKDPAAVRTTKDIDVLLPRTALARARAAARSVDMDYFETMGVGMFLDRSDPNPRHGVRIVWAGEIVRPGDFVPAPQAANRMTLPGPYHVISLAKLVEMKLMADREQDRLHLRDMIDVGLIEQDLLAKLPAELSPRLAVLLGEQGR